MSAWDRAVDPETVQAAVQGNVLRAYGDAFLHVRHLVLEIGDRASARAALRDLLDPARPGPHLTTGATWPEQWRPDLCTNIGFTAHGLAAIGVPAEDLATFPPEFLEGMAARARMLGDVGPSAPEHWRGGLDQTHRVDVIITFHAQGPSHLDRATDELLWHGRAWTLVGDPLDGRALTRDLSDPAVVDRTRWADQSQERAVHFGYRDGIEQPRVELIQSDDGTGDPRQFTPLGALLVGEKTTMPHVWWAVPQPDVLGRWGVFNAFRVLEQDVEGFHRLVTSTAAGHDDLTPDLVAAKLCGRHPDGTPLATVKVQVRDGLGPDGAPSITTREVIGYADDPEGLRCPIGAHVRRANPRDSVIVQRASNEVRRVTRRGVPYGPPYDPEGPDDGERRGLLGNFLCADLGAQFEALQNDWMNLGFQDPRITGTNDPLVGNHDPLESPFRFVADPSRPDDVVEVAVPQLVRTAGGAYTFLPSVAGLAWLARD